MFPDRAVTRHLSTEYLSGSHNQSPHSCKFREKGEVGVEQTT